MINMRGAALILLASALLATPAAAAERSRAVRAEFQREHPCPSTGKTRGACPGYQADHIRSLCSGGTDSATNLQWLSEADHKAKTRKDVGLCRAQKAGVVAR